MWRRLHSERLNDLYWLTIYCSDDQIKRNEMGGAYSTFGGEEGCIQSFGSET